jgi:hypothetical protein
VDAALGVYQFDAVPNSDLGDGAGHGRVAVNCPACTGRALVLMPRGSNDATGRGCDGLVALDQALAEMRAATGAS